MAQQVKNLPANEGVARDAGYTPQSGRSPEEEMATHSSIIAWKIPRTEEHGGLQSMESQRVGHDRAHLQRARSLIRYAYPFCFFLANSFTLVEFVGR